MIESASLKKNIVFNTIYNISNIVFPLITFSYVSRMLTVELIGRVSFFSTISNYAIMLASLGISSYGIRAVAQRRDNKKELSKTSKELFYINCFATVIVLLGIVMLSLFVDKLKEDKTLLSLNCLLIAVAPLGMNWFFSGLEAYDYITKRNLIVKVSSLFFILFFVESEKDYLYYAAALVFSSAIAYIYNFVYANNYLEKDHYVYDFKRHFRPMLYLFASILAINIYTHLDTVMLGFISGDKQVGLYTIAVYVKTGLLTLINSVSVVLFPRISFYFIKNDIASANKLLQKSSIFIAFIAIPLTVFSIYEAPNIIIFLGGNGFIEATFCMQIIMPILLISGLSNITGNQILIPLGKENCFMKAVISGSVINLMFNFLLMPKYGAVGAAIATLIAEFTQMSIQVSYAYYHLKDNFKIISIMKLLLASLASLLIIILLPSSKILNNAIIDIIISWMVFIFFYFIFVLMIKDSTINSLVKEFVLSISMRFHRE